MTEASYDLTRQAWIPVRRIDGSLEELSLREVFARAHTLTAVTGELPTTGLALLRLLLAVLQRTVQACRPTLDTPRAVWQDLWDSGRLPAEDVTRYLDTWADRFDLLSPTVPFLQVADLRTAKGEVSELSKLVADVPNGAPFFTGRSGDALARLGFAEAARWLVHCQAFDPSGIKTGAVGDPRVKGGRGYPIGTAWCGAIGAVVLEGRSLHETLLLNLPLTRDNGDALPSEDRPVWERTPLTETEENGGGRVPVGPADLLTWPSRRVRLVHDDRAVTGVLICNGDPCQQQDAFAEPMTAWRRSEAQEKKLGRPTVYMPSSHDPQRSMWRGLAALLPLDMDAAPHTGAPRRPPLTIVWLHRLLNDGMGPDPDLPLRTRAIGVAYGSQSSVVDDLVDDALVLHAVLLGEHGHALRAAALDAVAAAELAARAVGQLAGNLAVAAGGAAENARDGARSLYYFQLDAAFRVWLAGLTATTAPVEALTAWHATARGTALIHEAELLRDAGPAAWVGRMHSDRGGRRHIDASLASLWFRSALHKALPLAVPSEPLPDHDTRGAA